MVMVMHVITRVSQEGLSSIAGVPFPPSNKLLISDVFDPRTNKPRPDVLKQHFVLEGRIDESAALKIINDGAALLRQEKTMIEIEAPVTGIYERMGLPWD